MASIPISLTCMHLVPCAPLLSQVKLKKLDDQVTMCVFIGYKYGGLAVVWDLHKSVVVESSNVTFFKEGMMEMLASGMQQGSITCNYMATV